MDKLRAIQYFHRAVECGSFAGAARSFAVSTPAVTQLIGALERSIGTILLHRSNRGLSLTVDGERYYSVSRGLANGLRDLERQLGPRGAKLRGTLTVGMRGSVGENCVMPHIGRFLAQFPDVDIAAKPVETLEEIDAAEVDLAVMTGWPPRRDFVVRPLAQNRDLVCASPDYWMGEGKPDQPEALRNHRCLVSQSSGGALLDRWTFEKDGESRSVDVSCRLLSYHSTWIQAAACAGVGVIRAGDLSLSRFISAGLLVPVLTDWEAVDSPSHFVLYRPAQRRSKLVHAFVDFLVQVFTELEAHRPVMLRQPRSREPRPEWFDRAHGRQSIYVGKKRSSRNASVNADRIT